MFPHVALTLPTSIGVAAIAPALLVPGCHCRRRTPRPAHAGGRFHPRGRQHFPAGNCAPRLPRSRGAGKPTMTQACARSSASPPEETEGPRDRRRVGAPPHVSDPMDTVVCAARRPRLRGLKTSPYPVRRPTCSVAGLAQCADGAVSRRAQHYRGAPISRRTCRNGAGRPPPSSRRADLRWCLALFAPVALRAALIFPLLTLQKHPDLGSTAHDARGEPADRPVRSDGHSAVRRRRHHAPRTGIARTAEPVAAHGALLLVGSGPASLERLSADLAHH